MEDPNFVSWEVREENMSLVEGNDLFILVLKNEAMF